jgi:hypothetical protein
MFYKLSTSSLRRFVPGKRKLSLSDALTRPTGPGLKDFIASAAHAQEKPDDSQWDAAPYLQDVDVAAKGRNGTSHYIHHTHVGCCTI